jgi:hypothetical protein
MKINIKYTSWILAMTLVLAPIVALSAVSNFKELVQLIISYIKLLIPLIVALTLLFFMWGVFKLVASNSEDSRKDAIAMITYGIISLFVMVSVWGLVQILTSTFFSGGTLILPQLK